MFNLVICMQSPPTNFQMAFKDEDAARAARVKIKEGMKSSSDVTIKDDYGQQLDISASNIAAFMIQDNELRASIVTDQNIDQARHNESFLERRKGDMELLRLFPGNQMQHPVAGRA